jgi:hypothetical protein
MDYLKPTMVARVQFFSENELALKLDHNPHLKPWQAATPNNVAGKGKIEVPGQIPNIVWQNRAAAPGEFENQLGDALERAFDGGAETLADLVRALDADGLRARDGSRWTASTLEAELAQLGS